MKLDYAVLPVKYAAALDVTLYSFTGELEGATGDPAPYKNIGESEADPVADRDSGCTYFIVRSKPPKVGVIAGADAAAGVYARLASKIIENELTHTVDANERMRLVLLGEASETQLLAAKAAYSADRSYYMFSLVCPENRLASLMQFMSAFKGNGDILVRMDGGTIAYARECGGEDEYQSANEFATVLHDNLSEELPFKFKICIGDVVHAFDDMSAAYAHARFAGHYGSLIDPASDIYSYKEYALVKMLAEVKRDAFANYAGALVDENYREVLADAELMTTAEMFMKNSLNISETSRSMYMHRNTLIYRLDKIEKATGLNIRQFNDAFTFRLIHLMYKLKR